VVGLDLADGQTLHKTGPIVCATLRQNRTPHRRDAVRSPEKTAYRGGSVSNLRAKMNFLINGPRANRE
jgi:hypothetical protein